MMMSIKIRKDGDGSRRLNCWEFHECCKEIGCIDNESKQICPATTEERLNGVHGGVNAGRACWVVVGTLCFSERQDNYKHKSKICSTCAFYEMVKNEEGNSRFIPAIFLQELLEQNA
ncbi:MAG: hypothetical protein JSV21_03430 [Nitrospirota bacterium]|nr:MAG: hypothetical protein JSV21_03430 [Nitrospirota bacterium]